MTQNQFPHPLGRMFKERFVNAPYDTSAVTRNREKIRPYLEQVEDEHSGDASQSFRMRYGESWRMRPKYPRLDFARDDGNSSVPTTKTVCQGEGRCSSASKRKSRHSSKKSTSKRSGRVRQQTHVPHPTQAKKTTPAPVISSKKAQDGPSGHKGSNDGGATQSGKPKSIPSPPGCGRGCGCRRRGGVLTRLSRSVRGAIYDALHWNELPECAWQDKIVGICSRGGRGPYLVFVSVVLFVLVYNVGCLC
jgi:hypothetical protein